MKRKTQEMQEVQQKKKSSKPDIEDATLNEAIDFALASILHRPELFLDLPNKELYSNRKFIIEWIKITTHVSLEQFALFRDHFKDDYRLMRKVVKKFDYFYAMPKQCRGNLYVAKVAIKRSHSNIEHALGFVIEDREIGFKVVRSNGTNLKWLAPTLKKDKHIILAAVAAVMNEEFAILHMDPELLKDEEFLIELLKVKTSIFGLLPKDLQENKTFVLKAVKVNARIYDDLSDEFVNDAEILITAVTMSPGLSFWYNIPESYKLNAELARIVLEKHGRLLQCFSDEIKADKVLVLIAVKSCGSALGFTTSILQDDYEVVMNAVSNYESASALEHASIRLRNNKEIVECACKHSCFAFKYAERSNGWYNDFGRKIIAEYGHLLEFAPDHWKSDKALVISAVQSAPRVYLSLSPEFITDEDVMLEVLKKDGKMLRSMPEMASLNRDLVYAAVSNSGLAMRHVNPLLKQEKELTMIAVETKGAFRLLDEQFWADEEVIKKAFQVDPMEVSEIIPKVLREFENAKYAVERRCDLFMNLPEKFLCNREIIILTLKAMVKQRGPFTFWIEFSQTWKYMRNRCILDRTCYLIYDERWDIQKERIRGDLWYKFE